MESSILLFVEQVNVGAIFIFLRRYYTKGCEFLLRHLLFWITISGTAHASLELTDQGRFKASQMYRNRSRYMLIELI
jgi:hypothetical protein